MFFFLSCNVGDLVPHSPRSPAPNQQHQGGIKWNELEKAMQIARNKEEEEEDEEENDEEQDDVDAEKGTSISTLIALARCFLLRYHQNREIYVLFICFLLFG